MLAATKHPELAVDPYVVQSLCKNPCLLQWDRSIPFKSSLSESEAYTLLNIIRHRFDDAYLVEMMKRLNLQPLGTTTDTWNQLLTQVVGSEFALVVYYESLALVCSLQHVNDEHRKTLKELQQAFLLSPQDLLPLFTRLYLDAGLRSAEDSLQSSPTTQKGWTLSPHPYQINLAQLNILPLPAIKKSCEDFLETFESLALPPEATAEIRVAVLALIGHAVRVDNTIDAKEKAFQEDVTRELGVTEADGKRYPYLLKSATVEELCSTIKKWSMANSKPAVLSATAAFLLRGLGSDGIVEIREEKFKTQLMQQLNIDSHKCARLLLRLHLDNV